MIILEYKYELSLNPNMNIKKLISSLPEIYIQKSKNLTFNLMDVQSFSELKRIINLIKIMNYYYIDSLNENKYNKLNHFLDIELYDKNKKHFIDDLNKLLEKNLSSGESEGQKEISEEEEEKDDFDDAEGFNEDFDEDDFDEFNEDDFVNPEIFAEDEYTELEPNNPLHPDFKKDKKDNKDKKDKKDK